MVKIIVENGLLGFNVMHLNLSEVLIYLLTYSSIKLGLTMNSINVYFLSIKINK